MEDDRELYLQLRKLSSLKSEEDLQHIVSILWRTRKTGLTISNKTVIQSLLSLPSSHEVELVSACLRSLIRRYIRENLTSDDILKLIPPDLSLDLQRILISTFKKNESQWKKDVSKDQNISPRTNAANLVNAGLQPLHFGTFPSAEMNAFLWPRQDDPTDQINRNNIGASSAQNNSEINSSSLASIPLQQDLDPKDCLGTLPRLKSMTWTLENRNRATTSRVAVITLKLQDYTRSPSGVTEVKFQVTKDMLEHMLKSMTYINQQLLSVAESSSGGLQKKQRQS